MAYQNVVDYSSSQENDAMEHANFGHAERLLQGLNDIDWCESIKESQRNWIGNQLVRLFRSQSRKSSEQNI
jgi:leucyl-tRNA synthetase